MATLPRRGIGPDGQLLTGTTTMPGTTFEKNDDGQDIGIKKTGVVAPASKISKPSGPSSPRHAPTPGERPMYDSLVNPATPIGPAPPATDITGDRQTKLWYSKDGQTQNFEGKKLPGDQRDRSSDSATHMGPSYNTTNELIRRQQQFPANPQEIFEGQPVVDTIANEREKNMAKSSALSTMHVDEGTFGQHQKKILNGDHRKASHIAGKSLKHINPITRQYVEPGHVVDYMPGYAKTPEERNKLQTLGAKDDGSTGNRFYVPDDNFVGNNPLRVTSKEVDDYARSTARQLVGDNAGEVIRDLETGEIKMARPHSSEKRRDTQHALSTLSRSLLTTFDTLSLDPKEHRLQDKDGDVHDDDNAGYEAAKRNYDEIAQDISYINVNKDKKWSGTPKFHTDGGISFNKGDGSTEILTTQEQDENQFSATVGEDVMNYNAERPDTPFYFNPELSKFKINVADKKSAVALSYTLRQFFDLQVLYYKKHMELLQVFQLLVIFFEKYNYSINSLMYILEHMIKDKIEVKSGDSIGVPIPIDFTKSIIGMLSDQKKMMTQVALFKSHLGMQDGGFERHGNSVILPDDNMFLHSKHPGLFSNVATGTDGTHHTYYGPNKQWYPDIVMDPSIAYMEHLFNPDDDDFNRMKTHPGERDYNPSVAPTPPAIPPELPESLDAIFPNPIGHIGGGAVTVPPDGLVPPLQEHNSLSKADALALLNGQKTAYNTIKLQMYTHRGLLEKIKKPNPINTATITDVQTKAGEMENIETVLNTQIATLNGLVIPDGTKVNHYIATKPELIYDTSLYQTITAQGSSDKATVLREINTSIAQINTDKADAETDKIGKSPADIATINEKIEQLDSTHAELTIEKHRIEQLPDGIINEWYNV